MENNMEKATIFYALQSTISNEIYSKNTTPEDLKIALKNKAFKSSDLYQTECYLYAQKVIKPSAYNDTLCEAYSYTYEDLVMHVTIKLIEKFDYLVKKYFDLHTQFDNEQDISKNFSGIVARIPETTLKDMFKHISEEKDYKTVDSEGKAATKHGRCLKFTTVSLDQNNADDDDENLSLGNCIESTEPTAEERIIKRDTIKSLITCLLDSPIELTAFLAKYCGFSSTSMISLLETSSATCMCSKIAHSFAEEFDFPEIIDIISSFTEEQLTYSGSMSLKRVYDNARYTSTAKVRKYNPQYNTKK